MTNAHEAGSGTETPVKTRLIIRSPVIKPEALYTAVETAGYLRISKRTLERWRTDGRGPRVTRLWEGGRPFYLGRHIFEAINVSMEAAPAPDEVHK
jgi:hypothetical protein